MSTLGLPPITPVSPISPISFRPRVTSQNTGLQQAADLGTSVAATNSATGVGGIGSVAPTFAEAISQAAPGFAEQITGAADQNPPFAEAIAGEPITFAEILEEAPPGFAEVLRNAGADGQETPAAITVANRNLATIQDNLNARGLLEANGRLQVEGGARLARAARLPGNGPEPLPPIPPPQGAPLQQAFTPTVLPGSELDQVI